MPLVRYEVQCEHSLANPELYRTAGRDDSEGLLEGVAMAGLVGIVRQLGDLTEFAAEIFHNLHDDIITIVSRGQNLKARVARLEVDLPAIEKTLLTEASRFRFAYSARSKWRAPLPMDHNLCSQGELPRFVQNFYDACRGPPRLFLLDKFDEAGSGACVKRYTDPTFFKISWASTQIEKAERREREDLLIAKNLALEKGTDNSGPKIYARERLSSALFENLEGFTGDFTSELQSRRLNRRLEVSTEGDLTPDGPRSPEEGRSPESESGLQNLPHLTELESQKFSGKDTENAKLRRKTLKPNEEGTLSDEDEESYVDAFGTMGSDPDCDHGSRVRWNADSGQSWFALESDQVTSLNHSVLKAHVEAHHLTPPRESEVDLGVDFARRLGLREHKSPIAVIDAVECESDTGESPHAQPLVEDEEPRSVDDTVELAGIVDDSRNDHANLPNEAVYEAESLQAKILDKVLHKLPEMVPTDKVPDKVSCKTSDKVCENAPSKISYYVPNKVPDIVPEKFTFQSHESVSLLDSYRVSARVIAQRASEEVRAQIPHVLENDKPAEAEKGNQLPLAGVIVKQIVDQNVEQAVTTSRSRRLWAKDNGLQVHSSTFSVKVSGSWGLSNILRARMLESSGHSDEDLIAICPHGEESIVEIPRRRETCLSSSNTSSPYANVSFDVVDEDLYTSSASSSPKGANFRALLSPSESPPRLGRGLMGSPMTCDADHSFGIPSLAPPIALFLSSSPSLSRCPSINDQPPVSSVVGVCHSPRLPSHLIPSAQRDVTLRNLLPLQTSVGPVSSSVNDSDKPSTLPKLVSRPRTWVDRSESNVAATLRAIRQATVVESDDETGWECPSDFS